MGQVAALAGVTVRTLHHYDRLGLLSPAERSEAGYRRYGLAEVERLYRILALRGLGFELAEIRTLLEAEGEQLLATARLQLERVGEQCSS